MKFRDVSVNAHIDQTSLRDQVAALLRDWIVSGQLHPGTKIPEREVADRLGISRMPVRDALLDLERQGLIIQKPGGRYVIELAEKDIRDIYTLRLALETLAVQEAIGNITPAQQQALLGILDRIERAVAENDRAAYTASDLAFHECIWAIADNPYLTKMLASLTGPIFLFIASQTRFVENWQETLELHIALAQAVVRKDRSSAVQAMQDHMQTSLVLALNIAAAEQTD